MASDQQQLEAGIAALEGQRAILGDAVVDAALAGLHAKLSALRAQPAEPAQSLKQISILFLDVVGSTALSQRLDPEEISQVMDGLLSRGTSIVESRGGKVLKYAGDNLLAVFGADEAAEDDAERAVDCGLALLVLGKSLGDEVRTVHGHHGVDVRVGIHTGDVLLGGGVDDDAGIRGQAVNIAARMEQTAPPGCLRISHDTYRSVRGVFEVDAQPPLPVKGLDEPMRTYLVVRRQPRTFKGVTRGIEGLETRMIGRDAELEALQDAVHRLMQPGAGLRQVVVVGEAGVGKSRLLYEFGNWLATRGERHCILQARATPQTQGQPYGLLRDMFASQWRILDDDSMDVAKRKLEDGLKPLFDADEGAVEAQAHTHLLGQLLGFDYGDSPHVAGIRDDAGQIRSRGFRSAAQALRRIGARDGSVVVVQLDDLHWADDGSLDFIDSLARVDRDVPMLVLALTRPTLFERRPGALRVPAGVAQCRVDLGALDHASSRLLADELLRRLPDIPASLRELVTHRAGGNPFYMEELVGMLIDRNAIVAAGERWTLDADKLRTVTVPSTLTGILQARLDSLPAIERQALQLASVIGLTFWDAALAHVESSAIAELPSLQRRELIHPKVATDAVPVHLNEYAFQHQILHQVTYDTVLKPVKRRAHARAADWMAHHAAAVGRNMLAAAAEQYERAGDVHLAAEFYARAAEYMAGTFVHDAALDYTSRALTLVGDDGKLRWRLLANRERVLDLLGRRDAQLADIDALEALADALPPGSPGDSRRADAAWRRADISHRIGDWVTQEREARRAMDLAVRAGDEPLALRAAQRLAMALAYRGDPVTANALAERGLARARALGLGHVQSGLLNVLTICADLLGDRVAGLRYSLLDLSLNRETGKRAHEAVALSNVGMSYLGFGAFDEARQYLEQALQLNRALGNRQVEGNTLAMLSELAWREGNPALALTCARAAHDISVEVKSPLHQVDSLWSLGNAELEHGRWSEAAAAFARSETLARETELKPQVMSALDGQIRAALVCGDALKAQRLGERLLEEARATATHAAACATSATDSVTGDSLSTDLFTGTYEHLLRLTLCRIHIGSDERRADLRLTEAYAALMAEADRILDDGLRRSFLTNIPEHRDIIALHAQRVRGGGRSIC